MGVQLMHEQTQSLPQEVVGEGHVRPPVLMRCIWGEGSLSRGPEGSLGFGCTATREEGV